MFKVSLVDKIRCPLWVQCQTNRLQFYKVRLFWSTNTLLFKINQQRQSYLSYMPRTRSWIYNKRKIIICIYIYIYIPLKKIWLIFPVHGHLWFLSCDLSFRERHDAMHGILLFRTLGIRISNVQLISLTHWSLNEMSVINTSIRTDCSFCSI